MKEFDAIIIGFGKGGKTLASDLANRGWKVAMVEKSDKMYGGTCINIGCIPTKVLVHQAKLADLRKKDSFENKKEFYRKAIEKKDKITSLLRNNNFHNLDDKKNITVYTGTGSFASPETVNIKTEKGTLLLKAPHIFINTGAETVIPPIKGIKENPFIYTSTEIMELTELPERLVIIGGGYIGLEFASIYASFGSQVTVLEGYTELLPREDRDIAESVKTVLEKKGILFKMGAKVNSFHNTGNEVIISYTDTRENTGYTLKADAVLLATGRRPNTKELNLEAAGVKVNEQGAIIADELLRTTTPSIRVMGDVKGGLQFTYISLDDYRIIRDDLFGDKRRKTTGREPISYSVFIDPPLSHIGLNEQEARKSGRNILVNKFTVSSIPRAKTVDAEDGMLKAVIDADTHEILGCTLFCPESSEVINTVSLAMKAGLDSTFLHNFIFTHPSMSEALNDLFS